MINGLERKPAVNRNKLILPRIGGLSFTFAIALLSLGLSRIPGIAFLGQLTIALAIAVIYRQIFGYPERIRTGIQFSSKTLLRLAIVLYGLKLNVDVVIREGMGLLALGAGSVVVSICAMMLLSRWLKADRSLALLLGIGTGVCGAAAIAAVSPVLKAKEEDTSISIGIVSLIGTIFAVGYSFIQPLLSLNTQTYAVWSGISLHEIAHVVLAVAPAGESAMATALLAKLSRVFLLAPLILALMLWVRNRNGENGRGKPEFPWFLLGFLLMSLAGSYLAGSVVPVPDALFDAANHVTAFFFTMAMAGLGLNVDVKTLRGKWFRPLLAVTATSVLLSAAAFFVTQ